MNTKIVKKRLIEPDGTVTYLKINVSFEEKKMVVEELLNKWSQAITKGWSNDVIKNFLCNLSDYLVWHKEEELKGREDKDVISIAKTKQMSGQIKSPSLPISSLSDNIKKILGEELVE